MFIRSCSAKLLPQGVNIVSPSNDHNTTSSPICGGQNKLPMEPPDPPPPKCPKANPGLGDRRSKLLQQNEIPPSTTLKTPSLQLFKALDSTCSRLHQRLQNPCKAPAISPRHDLKSICTGNPHPGPSHTIDRILESVMIFKSPAAMILDAILNKSNYE